MLREIRNWRRHENSVRFGGSRPREEGADKPISVVPETGKHYGSIRRRPLLILGRDTAK